MTLGTPWWHRGDPGGFVSPLGVSGPPRRILGSPPGSFWGPPRPARTGRSGRPCAAWPSAAPGRRAGGCRNAPRSYGTSGPRRLRTGTYVLHTCYIHVTYVGHAWDTRGMCRMLLVHAQDGYGTGRVLTACSRHAHASYMHLTCVLHACYMRGTYVGHAWDMRGTCMGHV